MPERHAGGSSSGSSSSGSSSSGSSYHSSSSSSSSSYRRYYNDGPSSPEEQTWGWIMIGIALVVLAVLWIGNQINTANQRRSDENATATTQAITVKDLAQMHAALDQRIPDWRKVTDLDVHHISASDAGFGPADNTKEVVYGYCKTGEFYVYILESSHPEASFADTEGYAHTPDSNSARDCHPPNWTVVSEDYAESHWYFVTLYTYSATSAARIALTPTTPTEMPTMPATPTPPAF